MTTTTPVTVAPFGIEADHPRNCDLLLQSIPGARLRSVISGSRTVVDQSTGDSMIPSDQANFLGQFPTIPGMQLLVNPAKGTYAIIDPLADDEQTCDRITRALERVSSFRSKSKIKGVAPQKGALDEHRMKTLVREMITILANGHAKVCKGAAPSKDDVDGMPGRYILNAGSRVPNTQPRFEDQWDDWVNNVSKASN